MPQATYNGLPFCRGYGKVLTRRRISWHNRPITGETVNKRPLTPGYLFFFLIFWPDTYRILIGLCAAFFLAPRITPPDQGGFGLALMYVMLACIGYAASAKPARSISSKLKKVVLKDKLS